MDLSTMQWLQNLSQGAANVLVSGTWEGFVLAVGIALFLKLLPRTRATTRFIIWAAAFLLLALLPFLHNPQLAQFGAAASASRSWLQLDVRWSLAITALWVILSLIRASSLTLHAFRLRALWKNSSPVDAGASCVGQLARGSLRGAQLCTTTELDRPSVIGFSSPRILIPSWLLEKLSPAELEHIVLHEVEHLRRGDDWMNLLQKLSLIVFPLNPVLMWIERRLCFERELACDDGVIHTTRAPRAYAACLASLAERGLDRREASLALGAWERQSALTRRVHSILNRRDVSSPLHERGLTSAVVVVLLISAVALSRCPQLVSFSATAHPISTLVQSHSSPSSAVYPSPMYSAGMIHSVSFKTSQASGTEQSKLSKVLIPSHHAKRTARYPAVDKVPQAPPLYLRRSKTSDSRGQHWIVLTSWTAPAPQEMRRSAMHDQTLLSFYTAVPTSDGWIILQL